MNSYDHDTAESPAPATDAEAVDVDMNGADPSAGADADTVVSDDATVLGDLDELESDDPAVLDVTPEVAVADSLNNALKQLRTDADALEGMPLDGSRIDAAEQLAEDAATLDEQIGDIARSDEG